MSESRDSIISFLNRRITIIYMIILFISLPVIYNISVSQMENEALVELNTLTNTLQKTAPDLFVAESEATTNSDQIKQMFANHENYFMHVVDISNLSERYQFSSHNTHIYSQFARDPSLQIIEGKMMEGSLELIYQAFPIEVMGSPGGFVLFGIQRDRMNSIIKIRVLTFIGLMSVMYAIFISSINTTLRKYVINPLIRINNRTRNVANGEIDKVFESKRTDELGQLIKSIELLRRSLKISLNMHQTQAIKSVKKDKAA